MAHDPTLPLTHWEGEPVEIWREVWQVAALRAHSLVDSTNSIAVAWAKEGGAPFSTVVATEQTEGRGREGRDWWGAPGDSVLVSVILPELERGDERLVAPIGVAVAAVRALRTISPEVSFGIKWPNDILVGDRKLGGILCEGVLEMGRGSGSVVAGLGLNLNQAQDSFPESLHERAVSLRMADGMRRALSVFLTPFLRALRSVFSPPPRAIVGALADEVMELDLLRDRSVSLSTGLSGISKGILPSGALDLETSDGDRVAVWAGSVNRWQ